MIFSEMYFSIGIWNPYGQGDDTSASTETEHLVEVSIFQTRRILSYMQLQVSFFNIVYNHGKKCFFFHQYFDKHFSKYCKVYLVFKIFIFALSIIHCGSILIGQDENKIKSPWSILQSVCWEFVPYRVHHML